MAVTPGETYRCTNPNCGCEMKVTQGREGEAFSALLLWHRDERLHKRLLRYRQREVPLSLGGGRVPYRDESIEPSPE
jgi:hypothetical protein